MSTAAATARPPASGDGRRFLIALSVTLVAAAVLVGLSASNAVSERATADYLTAVHLPISDASETFTFVLQDAVAARRAGEHPQLRPAVAAMTRLKEQLSELAVPADLHGVHEQIVALAQQMAADLAMAEDPDEQLVATIRVQRGLREFGAAVRSVAAIRAHAADGA